MLFISAVSVARSDGSRCGRDSSRWVDLLQYLPELDESLRDLER